jgi:hypothetical protein
MRTRNRCGRRGFRAKSLEFAPPHESLTQRVEKAFEILQKFHPAEMAE